MVVDDCVALDKHVRADGVESDRPLFVLHELPVTRGTHHLSIAFERAEDGGAKKSGNPNEESDNRESHDLRETPRSLTLDDNVTLDSRAVVVVTYDDERRRLALLAAPDSGR